MRSILDEAAKFLTVGVWNTFVGLMVIYLAKWLWQFGDAEANLLGYAVGFVISFTLNSRWTFKYQGPYFSALVRFLVVTIVAYLMNLATVLGAINYLGIDSYLAQAIGIAPYTLTSFLASKFLVFRRSQEKQA